jgi:hypothetical protein
MADGLSRAVLDVLGVLVMAVLLSFLLSST